MRALLPMLLSSLLVLLGMSGCHSLSDPTTGTTRVSGQVVESQSRKPVPNATVQVWHESTAGGYRRVGSGYPADGQGRFAFDFEADDKSGYIVLATAPPGYVTDWQAGPRLTAGRKNEGLVIPTTAPAWVKLQLMNTSGRQRYQISINGYGGSSETIYNPKDTVLIRTIQSGLKRAISWEIVDQTTGALSQGYEYIQPNALDTARVRIPF